MIYLAAIPDGIVEICKLCNPPLLHSPKLCSLQMYKKVIVWYNSDFGTPQIFINWSNL